MPNVRAFIDCDPSTPRVYDSPAAHLNGLGRQCEIHCGEGNVVNTVWEATFQCSAVVECRWDSVNLVYQPLLYALSSFTPCDINGNSCDGGFCSGNGECVDNGGSLRDGEECEDLDGNPCTIEHCEEGMCRPADPNDPNDNVQCDDNNSCTTEICDGTIQIQPNRPRTDACVYTPVPYNTTDRGGRLVCEGCGDGNLQTAQLEECDDGNFIDGDGCDGLCRLEACGNGRLEIGEQCDDGNLANGDGCSSICQDEAVVCPTLTCTPPSFPYNPTSATTVTCTAVGGANWVSATIDCDGNFMPVTSASPSAQCFFSMNGQADIFLIGVVGVRQTLDCGNVTITSSAACGDQILNQPNEECDNGANNSDTASDACRTDCTNPRCGDGVADAGEGCDDANSNDADSCTRACALPTCGDGVIQAGEDCEDLNSDNTDGCLTTCEFARCGDGFTQIGVEACDDGNANNGDACLTGCRLAFCGDGFTRVGTEECDDANAANDDACLIGCRSASCGDGFLRTGVEVCDDGNNSNDDACTQRCAPPGCGDGFLQGSEACDDGNPENTDDCLNSCAAAQCGDGFVRTGEEECDDANRRGTDECLNDCRQARCGDGIVQTGVEACDNGGLNSDTRPNACRADCRPARCGDGVLDAPEACDDGNTEDRDRCHNNCTIPTCIPENEICDGRDNDCDGLTDEDSGETACGQGVCRVVAPNCVNGAPNACVPLDTMGEFCNDLVDNDCDGQTDEDCGIGPLCDGPDENGDGIPDICLTPTQSCLGTGGKVDPMPAISIQDVLESRNHPVSVGDEYVIENGVIIGRCVQVRVAAQFSGSSIFGGVFGPAEAFALGLFFIFAKYPRRRKS